MEPRLGVWQRKHRRRSWWSSAPASGASATSDDRRRSATKSSDGGQDSNQSTNKSDGGSEAEWDTRSLSQHPASHARRCPGIRTGRGRGGNAETAGRETPLLRWRRVATPAEEQRGSPEPCTTEDCRGWPMILMRYIGLSKYFNCTYKTFFLLISFYSTLF